jgi:hypothetical protein
MAADVSCDTTKGKGGQIYLCFKYNRFYLSKVKINLCKIIGVKSKILDLGEYQKPVSLTSGI